LESDQGEWLGSYSPDRQWIFLRGASAFSSRAYLDLETAEAICKDNLFLLATHGVFLRGVLAIDICDL
jgi:hypothetical protein